MNTREMKWLLELRKTKNFTKASENVFTTQSALSQCVSRVEDEVEFQIFNRTRRAISETEHGTHFLNMLEQILDKYNRCLDEIHSEDISPFSTITIGVTPYVNSIVSNNMSELRRVFPQVRIRLLEGNSDTLIRLFEEGQLQILNINSELDDPSVHCAILSSFRMFILLRTGSQIYRHAVNIGEDYPQLDPKYLKEEPLAASAAGSYSRRIAMRIYQHAGIQPEFIQSVTRPTTLCNLALNGTASSIFALSSEIQESLKGRNCLYSIPKTYKDANGLRYLCCKKENLRRMPSEFFNEVENLFRKSLSI